MNYGVIQSVEGVEYKWSSDHTFVKSIGALTEGRFSMVEAKIQPGLLLG